MELLRGTLDVLVLRALAWETMHGHAVMRWLQQRSDDELLVEEGAIYPALHRLEREGWVESEWGVSENNRRAKYYAITARGRTALQKQQQNWERYVAAVARVLDPG